MSEEQPEERLESEAEHSSAGNLAEESIESESPAGDAAEPQLGIEMVDSPGEEPKAPTPKDSRAGGFLKRALRWVVIFLVVFTLGIVAMQIVRVRPLTDEQDSLSQSLEAFRYNVRPKLVALVRREQGLPLPREFDPPLNRLER